MDSTGCVCRCGGDEVGEVEILGLSFLLGSAGVNTSAVVIVARCWLIVKYC